MRIKVCTTKEREQLVESLKLEESLGNLLEEMNFKVAENIPWPEYRSLHAQIKKTELLFKTYILACAKNDKELRIDTMKIFKELIEALPEVLVRYRKHVLQCLKEKKDEEK